MNNLSRRVFLTGLSASVFDTSVFAQTEKTTILNAALILNAGPIEYSAKPGSSEKMATLGYNNFSPGPLLHVKKGQTIRVSLQNSLESPTSLHFYGIRGLNAMDGTVGLTQAPVKKGDQFDYAFVPPDSGTFWYHPLCSGSAASQFSRGLQGLLIVEEINPPDVDQDIAVVINDWNLADSGEISVEPSPISKTARGGKLGNFLTVNGLKTPQTVNAVCNGRIRLRLLNATNARLCPLKFSGIQAHVIAIDGQPCDPFDPLRRTVIMAPGSRFDIIVDIPVDENKQGNIGIGLGVPLPLLTIVSKGAKVPSYPSLTALKGNNLPPAILLQNATRADLIITGGAVDTDQNETSLNSAFPDKNQIWQLNSGKIGGFTHKPLLSVKRGTPIVLNIANRTAWPHVIHVHGHNFRLLHAFDDGWEPYFLDTLYIKEGRNALISFVADNPGKWAIRSAILDHFEGGLATWFEVA